MTNCPFQILPAGSIAHSVIQMQIQWDRIFLVTGTHFDLACYIAKGDRLYIIETKRLYVYGTPHSMEGLNVEEVVLTSNINDTEVTENYARIQEFGKQQTIENLVAAAIYTILHVADSVGYDHSHIDEMLYNAWV
jgi:hypothetical protein